MILYGVKEKHPRKVYAFAVRAGAEEKVRAPWDAERKSLGMKDLSGIHFHAPTRHLLILSDESRCLVECTTSGVEVSRMSLARGSAGLKSSVPQPEGVTMDGEGRLYIVSEPNMLYIFEKRRAAPGGGR